LNRCWPRQNKAHQRTSNEQTEIFLKQFDTNSVEVRTNVERYGQQKNKKRRSRFIRPAGIFLFPFSPNLLVVFMFLLTDQQMQGTQLIDQIQTATMFSTMEMKQQDTVERKL